MSFENDLHPWAEFLYARRNAILWMREEMGRTDYQIAWELSMDEAQVTSIANAISFSDHYKKIRDKKLGIKENVQF